MANAANGEPLAFRNAVILYSAQSTQGTAVTPATACGLATGRRTLKTGIQRYRGPGSPNLKSRKGGMTGAEIDLRFPAVTSNTKALLLKAQRSGGVLPWITVGLGYKDDQGTPNKAADQIQDCKVSRLRLGLDASGGHGPLTADLTLLGGLKTTLTTLVPGSDTSTPYETYEGVFQKGGVAYPVRTLEVTVDHALKEDCVIPGTAPSSGLRQWAYLTEHAETISGTISRYQPPGVNVQADTLPTGDLTLVLTNVDDATTFSLTLTSCDFGDEEKSEDENGIVWSFPFEAASWSLA